MYRGLDGAVQVIMVGAPTMKVQLDAGNVKVDVQLSDPNKELNHCWCALRISFCVLWCQCAMRTHGLSACRKYVDFVDVLPYSVEVCPPARPPGHRSQV